MPAELVDFRRPLSLFAESIVGEYVELDTERRAGVNALVLPARVDQFQDAELDRRAYRLEVLRGLAEQTHGVLTFDMATAVELFADLLPPERHAMRFRLGGTPVDRFARMTTDPALVTGLFTVLEAFRVSTWLCRHYPGVRFDVARQRAFEFAQLEFGQGSVERELHALLDGLWTGRRATTDSPIEQIAAGVMEPGASVYRAMEAALLIASLVSTSLVDASPRSSEDDVASETDEYVDSDDPHDGPPGAFDDGAVPPDSDRDATAHPAGDPIEAGGTAFLLDLEDGEYLDTESSGGDLVTDLPAHQWRSSPIPEWFGRLPREMGSAAAAAPRRDGDRTFRYREWDYTRQLYEPDWCRVVERRVVEGPSAFMDELRREHGMIRAQIKRRLAMIVAEQLIRVHDSDDGDTLSIDAVIGTIVDRRAGVLSDAPLYMRRDRAERDVAAAFLIDLSRSTESPAGPSPEAPISTDPPPSDRYDPFGPGYWDIPDFTPPPAGRRVIDVAREAVALLCEPLGSLGDRHAIYGFSGRGRHQVDFLVAKEFEDRASTRTWSALGAMEPMGYTRMGPAVRHAAHKLTRQGARTRLLVMISDGYPQDEGYGPTPGDRDYGIHDTAQALREAEAAGVTTFCITVDPAGHDYLRRMCPEQRYLVIQDIETLASELEKIYSELTARARPRRRTA